jgi:hypothetical protein
MIGVVMEDDKQQGPMPQHRRAIDARAGTFKMRTHVMTSRSRNAQYPPRLPPRESRYLTFTLTRAIDVPASAGDVPRSVNAKESRPVNCRSGW